MTKCDFDKKKKDIFQESPAALTVPP